MSFRKEKLHKLGCMSHHFHFHFHFHKNIMKKYNYEQHFWGAELAQSALEKKREMCISPLQYFPLPPGTLCC